MAGDWIKFELSTLDKPEVYQIADLAGIDEDATIGKLLRVWGWFDQQTEKGNAPIVSKRLLDRLCGVSGFCDHMVKAGWMIEEINELDRSLSIIKLPNFDRHNGKTAKNRALTAKRVASHKEKTNAEANAPVTLDALPREEKRREEETKDSVDGCASTGGDLFDSQPDAPKSVKYGEVQNAYNEICGEFFPKCSVMNEKRKSLIRKAADISFDGFKPFKEHGIPFWEAYFADCIKNPHWCGRNDRGWRANFDFVLKVDNVIKVLEEQND